jgi:hypothetical protein
MPVSLPLGEIQPLYSSCVLNNFLILYFSKAPRNSSSRYRLSVIFWLTFSIRYKIHAKFTCKIVERRTNSLVIQQMQIFLIYFCLRKYNHRASSFSRSEYSLGYTKNVQVLKDSFHFSKDFVTVVKCSLAKCSEVLQCNVGTSNEASNIIRRHIDNMSCCLYVFCYYHILSYSLGSFYQYMIVFLFNIVIYVFLL